MNTITTIAAKPFDPKKVASSPIFRPGTKRCTTIPKSRCAPSSGPNSSNAIIIRRIASDWKSPCPTAHHDRVLDPACGSGGFLLHALDHIRRQANTEFPDWETDLSEKLKHYRYRHDFAQHQMALA